MKRFLIILLFLGMNACLIGVALASEIEGPIESLDLEKKMVVVSGVEVDVSNAKFRSELFIPIRLKNLEVGKYISAEGLFDDKGVLMARSIEKQWKGTDQVRGRVKRIDSKRGKILINKIEVVVPEEIKIKDNRNDKELALKEINLGKEIECKGVWTDYRELTASEIEMD